MAAGDDWPELPDYLRIPAAARAAAWAAFGPPKPPPAVERMREVDKVRAEVKRVKTTARIAKLKHKQEEDHNSWEVRACGSTFRMTRAQYARILSELPTASLRQAFEQRYRPPEEIKKIVLKAVALGRNVAKKTQRPKKPKVRRRSR